MRYSKHLLQKIISSLYYLYNIRGRKDSTTGVRDVMLAVEPVNIWCWGHNAVTVFRE
jgi:hypothetical protein